MTGLTKPNGKKQREVERFREEARHLVGQGHVALDGLDCAGAIASARALRSVLYRAAQSGIDAAALAPDPRIASEERT